MHKGMNVRFAFLPSVPKQMPTGNPDPTYLEHMPHTTTGVSVSKAAPF